MTIDDAPIDDARKPAPPASEPSTPATEAGRTDSLRGGLPLLWGYARPHLRTIALGTLLGLFATAVTLATPMATKWVLDSLGTGLDLTRPVALLVGLLVVGTLAGITQSVLLGRLAEHVVLDARRALIQRFFRAKLEQIQRFRSGELVTRVTSDTVLLREAATSSIVDLINGAVSLVGTIVLMAILDVPLLFTTLAALLVIGVLLGILLPKIGKAEKRAQDAIGELGATLEGGVRALRTVKAARTETREIARVTAKADESARYSIRSVWYSATIGAVAGGGLQLATIVILGVGAWRVSLGELAVSTLVAFLLYAFSVTGPIATLTGAFTSLQSGLAAAARIRETEHLDPEDTAARPASPSTAARPESPGVASSAGTDGVDSHDHVDNHDGAETDAEAPVLALRNVTAGYESAERPALRGVTLEIPRTGHVALVGPSGAGKTTVFSLLLRFIDPTDGRLEVYGVPYDSLSIDEVRSRMSYVEQETPVIPGTVRDNVLFRIDDGATDAEAWEALEAVRLGDKVRSLPQGLDAEVAETSLSGGERQRLAVARALVRRPDVLLLDEATAQLDGTTEAAIQQVIAEASTTGAVVTIAHRLSTILDADTIVVLDQGAVRDSGLHHELLQRDELYREFIAALRIHTGEIHPEQPATSPQELTPADRRP